MNDRRLQNNSRVLDILHWAWPRIASPIKSTLLPCITWVFFLGLAFEAHAGWLKPDVDLSDYDVPLYQQITNHIKSRILARLGEGRNRRDRYFVIPFAYENKGNNPEFSHSFLTVIRVLPDALQPNLTLGLTRWKHKNREFETFTISWMPHDFMKNPDLCVFRGLGSRIFPAKNLCPTSIGRNFSLDDTIRLAVGAKNAVCMWGPYEVKKEAFDLGVRRMRLLNKGIIRYRADDRITRKDQSAINCFHAITDLEDLFPNGGLFGTGFKMWGINGTTRVLIEYKAKESQRGLLLEPIDEKRDRYGFVYAPTRNGHGLYNPFKYASAYRR
jgi:hypothetical protein